MSRYNFQEKWMIVVSRRADRLVFRLLQVVQRWLGERCRLAGNRSKGPETDGVQEGTEVSGE